MSFDNLGRVMSGEIVFFLQFLMSDFGIQFQQPYCGNFPEFFKNNGLLDGFM